ncbi:MAG: alkaline phosphatase PhoX [Weeksellaceae bacterium]
MKQLFTTVVALTAFTQTVAQNPFPQSVQPDWNAKEVVVPPSPFDFQVLFVGNTDYVQTSKGDSIPAKQWHDFIGFTPMNEFDCSVSANPENELGWVSVNHEMIQANDKIGDGGGMTTFKIARNPQTELLEIVPQKLTDGREGKFFNVDFRATGETGMNCGGITSTVDGRIWTAEEWWRSSNKDISYFSGGTGIRDTADFTIKYSGIDMADFKTIKKYQNFNWMVEIDPREAKAIRKQYNWGRQAFEGGAVAPDNKTVYLSVDNTPGYFSKFIADKPGEFTSGSLYVYKQDAAEKWIKVDNGNLDNMLNYGELAAKVGATMFNRLEWTTYDTTTGLLYMTETGRDNPARNWNDDALMGGAYAPHHINRAKDQGTTPDNEAYWDYYGRVLVYNPETMEVSIHVEGGPYFSESPDVASYPNKHLSNPDGLNMLYVNDKSYLLICEDLNGSSYGRMPAGTNGRMCELYLLDTAIENPTVDDLVRITQTPMGAEITGAIGLPDGKSILANSQHPADSNPAPYNNSLTFAITGFDRPGAMEALSTAEVKEIKGDMFKVHPNPVERILYLNKPQDVAVYNELGQRILVVRDQATIDVSSLESGLYYMVNNDGETRKVIVK